MRTEKDSMGEVMVPDAALWGASTQRAVDNFRVSGHRMPARFIGALGQVKAAAARVNGELGLLPAWKAEAIRSAAHEVASGALAEHFPVDVFQTGSGTSTNMNANEVIARRALQLAAAPGGGRTIHPNDDVNLGQSSNDIVPTALHVSAAVALKGDLLPALDLLAGELEAKSAEFADVVKLGRTHLMDAVPMTLGQEFSGYAAQVRKAKDRVRSAVDVLCELAIGGSAVGTGLNVPAHFAQRVCEELARETLIPFREAENHFEAQAARDDAAEVAGVLAAIAAALSKIANDIRLLSSGPRAGLAEIRLPELQPGSSIMPGKANPVMCEALVQAAIYAQAMAHGVLGCCGGGQLELNATLPLMAHCLHEAIGCLSGAVRAFAERCVRGIVADAARCRGNAERSLMVAAALNSRIGYDAGAKVAKEALASGKSVRQVVLERGLMGAAELDEALDVLRMTGRGPGAAPAPP
ncbi:MAG TPA: class II fumarate hydratase [Opitutaceae bacterium]